MAFERYTISDFISAKFNNDYSVMSEEDMNEAYTEYIDLAGLYETNEFNKVSYIHFLNNRINTIKISIDLQKRFIKDFGVPYLPELVLFKKLGHSLKWNNDVDKFIKSLDNVQLRENKYISELEIAIEELVDIRTKRNKKDNNVLTRNGFIGIYISLGKLGYRISKNETTLEEMAIMIRKQIEENKS
jgi:hypothetical protein